MPLLAPGYRFDRASQKLVIFTPTSVRTIGAWPRLDAFEKAHEGGGDRWVSYLPTFALVRPYRRRKKKPAAPPPGSIDDDQLAFGFAQSDETSAPKPTHNALRPIREQRRRALDAYRFSMPREIARAVDGYRSHQWPLLHALRWIPKLTELAATNPALFFLFCQRHAAAAYAGAMPDPTRLKHTQIAELLGLDGSSSTAKILSKVPAASIQGDGWESLLEVLSEDSHPARKALTHLAEVNFGALTIALQPAFEGWASPALLQEVSLRKQERHIARTADLLRDLIAMRRALDPTSNPRKIQSVERLTELHRETTARYIELDDRRAAALRFPRPPVAGDNLSILPITTGTELVEEGRSQENCVATYASRVIDRECYIYKVLAPQRCTLSLVPGRYGFWEIDELEVAANQPASPATRRAVETWLDAAMIPE